MSDTNFFTQATNLTQTTSGNVDVRTGLYQFHINLANIVGNYQQGPNFNFALTYNPLNTKNIGFGKGVTTGVSYFDIETNTLSLSNGETYKVNIINGKPIILQHRLSVFTFERNGDDSYIIKYQSGAVEILQGSKYAAKTKLPMQIISPEGHNLFFKMDTRNRITHIKDDNEELLSIDYTSTNVVFKIFANSQEQYKAYLIIDSELLKKVTLSNDGDPRELHKWIIGYTKTKFGPWASSLTSPNGLVEKAKYSTLDTGHKFPTSYPSSFQNIRLPYVVKLEQFPKAEQESVVKEYSYSGNNFLGYNAPGIQWSENQDNIQNAAASNYHYTVTETIKSAKTEQKVSTTYSYNNYHLLTLQSTVRDGKISKLENTYNIKLGKTLDKQPITFKLPKIVTNTWKDDTGERTISTYKEYNDVGLETLQINNYDKTLDISAQKGFTIRSEYYPVEGEQNKCPQSIFGKITFLKKKVTTPSRFTSYSDSQMSVSEEYTYVSLPTNNTLNPYVVKNNAIYMRRANSLQATTETSYDANNPAIISKIKITKINPDNANDTYVTIQNMTHTYSQDKITTITTTEIEGSAEKATSTEVMSRYCGHTLFSENQYNQSVTQTYDAFGRTTSTTKNKDTHAELHNSYEYIMNQDNDPMKILKQDHHQNHIEITLDGLNRNIGTRYKVNEESATWQQNNLNTYSASNQLISTQSYTYNKDSESTATTCTTAFDGWNQKHKETLNNGLTAITETSPIDLTSTTYFTDAIGNHCKKQVTHMDIAQRPYKVEYYDGNSIVSTVYFEYDDYNRIRKFIDQNGQVTTYTYNALGHPILEVLPDGTQIKKEYYPFSDELRISKIYVNDKLIGEREYDKWQRVASEQVGGRTKTYHYEGLSPNPTSINTGEKTVEYTYDSLTQNPVSITSGDVTQSFTYNNVGNITSATEGSTALEFTYDTQDIITAQKFTLDDQTYLSSYEFNSADLMSTLKSGGRNVSFEYNDLNRPIKAVCDQVEVTFRYDSFNRLESWHSVDSSNRSFMHTSLAFDNMNREIRRTIKCTNGTWIIENTYNNQDNIIQKKTLFNNTLYRNEEYAYDVLQRLTHYTCNGTTCPLDQYGNIIREQTFTYDALNNITSIKTTFKDGSKNDATYCYSYNDPCQLYVITNTHTSYQDKVELYYNKEGAIVQDEKQRMWKYDDMGRLISISDSHGNILTSYRYNAFNKLITQDEQVFHYYQESLIEISKNDEITTLLNCNGCHAQIGNDKAWLIGLEANNTPLTVMHHDESEDTPYAPYGGTMRGQQKISVLGFNGEYLDKVIHAYHLGNGYRVYDPQIASFRSPDSLSPFDQGGINCYAYCAGDPVNRQDPTGHSWFKWLMVGIAAVTLIALACTGVGAIIAAGGAVSAMGIQMGVAGITMSLIASNALSFSGGVLAAVSAVTFIASTVLDAFHAAPKVSNILNIVSTVTGVLSVAVGAVNTLASSWNGIKSNCQNMMKALAEWWKAPTPKINLELIKDLANTAKTFVSETLNSAFKSTIAAVCDYCKNVYESVKNLSKVITLSVSFTDVGKSLAVLKETAKDIIGVEQTIEHYILKNEPSKNIFQTIMGDLKDYLGYTKSVISMIA